MSKKIPLIIPWQIVQSTIVDQAKPKDANIFPRMIRSGMYWVYSHDYIKGKFTQQYNAFKEQIRQMGKDKGFADYIAGSGMCDLYQLDLIGGLNRVLLPIMGHGEITHKGYLEQFGYTKRLGDFVGGAFDARFVIPSGQQVNNVWDAGHSALMVLTTKTGSDINCEVFEGQNTESVPLTVFPERNVDLWHVGM